MDTLVGKTLSHYRIVEKIGAGGMGEVYRAHDSRLGRDVAIKALPEAFSSDPDRLARFEREAKALASLNHPNVAGIYGVEEAGGHRYLALEFVEGETLASRVARGPLPIEEAIEICLQIATGMEAAHEGGIIHRDLKPGNVMITPGDQVKVVDFGLAKTMMAASPGSASDDSPTVTASLATMPGMILGTAAYVSPEQARGKVVDRRTDIWSFGCVLYECLAGKRPFGGDTPAETMAKILQRDPDWSALPAKTPPSLVQLLQHCLERDPKHRLRDIGDARLALEEMKAGRASAGTTEGAGRTRRPLSRFLPLVAPLLAVILGIWLWNLLAPEKRHSSPPPTKRTSMVLPGGDLFSAATPSIAVLPFTDMSPGKDQEYFADGLSEELINLLANIGGVRVVSRTSAFSFKGKDVDLATVAQKLNVRMILEGSVRKAGKRLRITAQLIHVATDSHIWSQTYDRDLKDVFALQDDIAQSVVKEVRGALLGGKPIAPGGATAEEEVYAAAKGRGNNSEAYALYLEGRFYENRRTEPDLAKGIEHYQQAVARDPDFALAWAWLSNAYAFQAGKGWRPAAEGFGLARQAAKRSLQLVPDLPEGLVALGLIQMGYDWDLRGAESSIQRALEIAPGNAEVLRAAADLASNLGRLDEAVTLGRRAVAVDPLNVPALRYLGMFAYNAGLLDESESVYRKAFEVSPLQSGGIHTGLSRVYLAQGRLDEAMAECEREPAEEWRLFGMTMAYYAKGQTAQSDKALRELSEKYAESNAFQIADAYAFRGDSDSAFHWLERAYKTRDGGLIQIKPNRAMRSLHSDPRWKPFLKKIGLDD